MVNGSIIRLENNDSGISIPDWLYQEQEPNQRREELNSEVLINSPNKPIGINPVMALMGVICLVGSSYILYSGWNDDVNIKDKVLWKAILIPFFIFLDLSSLYMIWLWLSSIFICCSTNTSGTCDLAP